MNHATQPLGIAQLRTGPRKIFTCFAAALSVVVFTTELSLAEDGPQIRMDPKFMEMLSSFQKKASEASEAITQNKKKGSETTKDSTDQGAGRDKSLDQAYKLMESLADFQKKAFGTAASDNPKTK
jgi:hypothetical protein